MAEMIYLYPKGERARMSYTEAQKKASIKYMSEKTDDIRLRVPKGLKNRYRAEAQKRGISMTQFIIGCVENEIRIEIATEPDENGDHADRLYHDSNRIVARDKQAFAGSSQ